MIKLKSRPPEPPTLKSEKVKDLKEVIGKKINNNIIVKSKDFKPYWREEDVRKTLWKHHNGKCCYCERKRELKRESDVEHYRPKSEITKEKKHPGYWWLAYEWKNYLIACKPCNQAHKKNHFPLLPDGKRAKKPEDDLIKEKPVLINPIDENPEEFIHYVWKDSNNLFVKAVGHDNDGRGTKTIELTQLNRPELVEERAELIQTLDALATLMKVAEVQGHQEMVNKRAKAIKIETTSKKKFAGFKRAFFHAYMLSSYVSTD